MAKEKYYGFSDSKSKAEVPTKEDIATAEVDSDEKIYSAKYFNKTIGKLSELKTSIKTSIVAAINKVWDTLEERTNGRVKVYADDAEGGHIVFTSLNGVRWAMDSVGDNFRLIRFGKDGSHAVHSLPLTSPGGTIGTVEQINAVKKLLEERTNGKVKIYSDAEGGNIRITSPLGTTWEMDAYKEYLRIYTMSQEGKYCGYTFGRDFTTGGGSIATKEELKPVKDMLITNVQTVGSAYGVTAKRRSTTHVTSVYFTGAHVGDKMAAYTQRNMGTIPAGYRPLAKVQSQVPGVNGLFLTVEPSGVVSMRNEHYAEISFSKLTVSGCVTYMNG